LSSFSSQDDDEMAVVVSGVTGITDRANLHHGRGIEFALGIRRRFGE
jgi:hypothetical protein